MPKADSKSMLRKKFLENVRFGKNYRSGLQLLFLEASADVPEVRCIRHKDRKLLLLNIPKPNEHLARPVAELHSDFFKVLLGTFLLLWNIRERILVF